MTGDLCLFTTTIGEGRSITISSSIKMKPIELALTDPDSDVLSLLPRSMYLLYCNVMRFSRKDLSCNVVFLVIYKSWCVP